jgi:hypothetical protein
MWPHTAHVRSILPPYLSKGSSKGSSQLQVHLVLVIPTGIFILAFQHIITDNIYCCTVHFDNIKIIFTNKCILAIKTSMHSLLHVSVHLDHPQDKHRLPEDDPDGPKHVGANA